MLRKQPLNARPARWSCQIEIVELQREIEQCLADVERREALTARITLPLGIGRRWTTEHRGCVAQLSSGSPRWALRSPLATAGTATFSHGPHLRWKRAMSSCTQRILPIRTVGLPTEPSDWSYLGGWDEPFRSLALAPLLSFAEPVAADPAIIGSKNWLHAASIWDGGVPGQDDPSTGKAAGRLWAASNSSAVGGSEDKKVAVAGSEDKKAAMPKGSTRGTSQVKKTTKRYSYANYVKKPQRRVTSRTKTPAFDPEGSSASSLSHQKSDPPNFLRSVLARAHRLREERIL